MLSKALLFMYKRLILYDTIYWFLACLLRVSCVTIYYTLFGNHFFFILVFYTKVTHRKMKLRFPNVNCGYLFFQTSQRFGPVILDKTDWWLYHLGCDHRTYKKPETSISLKKKTNIFRDLDPEEIVPFQMYNENLRTHSSERYMKCDQAALLVHVLWNFLEIW